MKSCHQSVGCWVKLNIYDLPSLWIMAWLVSARNVQLWEPQSTLIQYIPNTITEVASDTVIVQNGNAQMWHLKESKLRINIGERLLLNILDEYRWYSLHDQVVK